MVKIEKINKDNYIKCLKLNVKDDQKSFVATNAISLAQAYVFPEVAHPFAIINSEDVVVGFMMLEVHKEDNEYGVWRLMVDKKHQGNGYGKDALRLGIEYLENLGATEIKLSHVKGNDNTSKLYESVGFQYNGELDGEELVMVYKKNA